MARAMETASRMSAVIGSTSEVSPTRRSTSPQCPVARLSYARTDSPRAVSAATRLDPMKPAAPVTRYLGLRKLTEPFTPPNLFHDARVFDFPSARSFFDVFQLAAHLALQLFVDGHVPLQDGAHLAPQHDVLGEDFIDVGGVHQDLEDLIEQVVDGLVADLDAHLLGGELLHARKFGGGDAPRLHRILGFVARFFFGAKVLVQDRFDVGLHFATAGGLDVRLLGERLDDIASDCGDFAAVEAHGPPNLRARTPCVNAPNRTIF